MQFAPFLFLFFVHLDLAIGQPDGLTLCNPPSGRPTCVCQGKKGLIDLTKIALDNGSPRFEKSDLTDSQDYGYDYNPCYPFTVQGSTACTSELGTAVCQEDGDTQYLVANMDTEQMFYDAEGNYQLRYTGGTDGRSAIVFLHCGNTRITTDGDSKVTLQYEFHLYTKEVCFGSDKSGWVGFVLILILMFIFAIYITVGILVLKFHFKKSGADIIPQKNFWFSLPFLVKDGVLFTVSPIVRLTNKDYQPITGVSKA